MRHYLLFIASSVLALQGGIAYCPLALGSSAAQSYGRLPAPVVTVGSQEGSSTVPSLSTLHGPKLHELDKGNSAWPVTPPSGQSDRTSSTGVSSAPGAESMMTQDLLLVDPNKNGPAAAPLQSFIGESLRLTLARTDIKLAGLRGLMITVVNDTSRPLVIDGDSAKIFVGSQTHMVVSVTVLQKSVLPSHTLKADVARTVAQVVPAAVTVGLTPTAEDFIRIKKPIRQRYGSDEKRRVAEASRFGKRILWPHQKTQGVLYIQTKAEIKLIDAKVQMPVQTLFDSSDNAVLTNK